MAEETEASCGRRTEEEEEAEEGIAKHDTSTSVNIIVRVSTVPENAKQL
jgi:hypothetical protein